MSSRSNKSGTMPVYSHMETVQKRKDEIFRKRQMELQEKLYKKEQRRQMLSQNKLSYTPKDGVGSPIVRIYVQHPGFDTEEKKEKPQWIE